MNKPDISAVTITSNPVNAKASFKIQVEVTDKEIVFSKVIEYTGEKFAGQEIGVI